MTPDTAATILLLVWLFVLPLALLFLWIRNARKASRLKKEGEKLAAELAETRRRQEEDRARLAENQKQLEQARNEISRTTELLTRFQPILDVEAEAASIAAQARSEADALLQRARAQEREAETALESARTQGYTAIAEAKDQAGHILAEARAKAEEIAGDALRARDKAKEYEQAVQALKNMIDGSGEQYIMPAQGLLDGLAEDFGFTEAGMKLKEARAHTRSMIKEGKAATCEYAEDNRRKTAVAFVVDAFNGKVDTALSKIRAENVGKLRQEIEDAFIVVNVNGQAFRNARITADYKQARLEELHWGAVAVELREQEREEQRAIKEKIREEEKARKEYERAMREAAKDEVKIQAALEKARMEMAKASEDQKTRYEQQLAELAEKLQEAEARSQRAQSMAEQTRSGYVYVISNIGSFGEEVFKIGMTRRLEPMDRVRELGDASVPFPFDVHAMIYCEDAPAIETALHKKFNEHRLNKVNPRKEFFRVGLATIRDAAQELGTEAKFTMLAQAQEYRESLAMEKLPKQELDAQLQRLLTEEVEEEAAVEEEA